MMLMTVEMVIFFVAVYLGVILRFYDWHSYQVYSIEGSLQSIFPRAIVFALVMFGVMTTMGLYQRDYREGPKTTFVRIVGSFFIGLLLMALVFYMAPKLILGRGAFGMAFFCAFIGIISSRFLCFHRTDTAWQKNLLILGVGHNAQLIGQLKRRTDHRGINLIGFAPIGNDEQIVSSERIISLGDSSLGDYVESKNIDEIVVAFDDRRNNIPIDDILKCKMHGVQVIDVSTFYERQLGKMKLDSLHPSNFIFSDGFTQAVLKSSGKRVFDVTVSALLSILLLPAMGLVALAIFLESGFSGPVIYRQVRVGLNGEDFEILKFRSMRVDAEKDGIAQWAQSNDNRITKVGAFIRKTRLDEIPQLYNVLRGDMSFVGPRPERPQFVSELAKSIEYYEMRHHVKPGITGWAQICYPYGASEEDAREKLQFDLYYLKNYSLFLDITILLQTVQVVLWSKGSR